MLEDIPDRKPGTNHLSEMRAHVEGDFGFTRGLATLVDASGKVIARVRFTDVFTYRDGRWRALAGHESLLGPTEAGRQMRAVVQRVGRASVTVSGEHTGECGVGIVVLLGR